MKTRSKWMAITALLGAAGMAQAAFVTIGNAGNTADTTGYGAVGYTYQISQTEVSIAEFQQATGAGNGNENHWNDGIRTVGTNAPTSYVTLYEARKYCNWLNTGDVDSGYYGAGGTNMSSQSHLDYAQANGVTYFVPTEDEWYKAAYYTGSGYSLYANGTGTIPTEGGGATGWNYNYVNSDPNYARDVALGTAEQNGTVNMMGNDSEWMEDSAGVIRGGSYFTHEISLRSSNRSGYGPSSEGSHVGFRVVAVPEPATALLFGIGGFGAWLVRRNKLKSSEE